MKKLLWSLLIAASIVGATNAFQLTFGWFGEWDPIRDKFSVVHFTLPDETANNFQGWFFWLPTQQILPKQSVTFNGVTKTCSKKVRGLYYTNAKGSRLWPLDQQTLNGLKLLSSDYSTLQINDALYTTCGTSWSAEIYSIYGQIWYEDNGADLGTLSAWLMYDVTNNAVDTTPWVWLYPTLQYFNNQTPIGYIYDNVGGIGFVGGQLPASVHQSIVSLIKTDTWKNINNIFWFAPWTTNIRVNGVPCVWTWCFPWGWANAWMDTIWNISVLGNVLLSRGGLEASDRQSVLGNPSMQSSVVFSDVVNTADILNKLRKNADSLCRGAEEITTVTSSTITDYITAYQTSHAGNNPKVICVANDAGGDEFQDTADALHIDLSDPDQYNGIEFVVKWRNVVLEGSIPSKQDAINIFVDNGNILLSNGNFNTEVVNATNPNSTNYTIFNAKWGMMNAYDDVAPIIGSMIQNTPLNPGGQTGTQTVAAWQYYLQQNLGDPAAHPLVSAKFVYDTMLIASWAGSTGAVTKANFGVYLRGNIFANWLIAGADGLDNPTGIVNKYYIHGRLASLNTALAPSQPRKTLINDIFGTYGATLQNYINFSNVFARQCLVNGYAADENGNVTAQPCKVSGDTFKFNPIVLINTGVPTKLLP